jgi:UDP-N-acetylmuramyl tripeptide synthase
MLAAIALTLALAPSPTHLTLAPWTGKNLPTATAAAIKYNLKVAGTPHATIHIEASGVAQGWIAAFCTPRVCAPTSVDVTLPDSGQAFYQFELIREDDSAPKKTAAKITTNDGASITVP